MDSGRRERKRWGGENGRVYERRWEMRDGERGEKECWK